MRAKLERKDNLRSVGLNFHPSSDIYHKSFDTRVSKKRIKKDLLEMDGARVCDFATLSNAEFRH